VVYVTRRTMTRVSPTTSPKAAFHGIYHRS
jgi:hypothetical protein